jgi:hypothetical protein
MTTNRYTVTYVFADSWRGAHTDVVSVITDTVVALRREGVDVELLGSTRNVGGQNEPTEVVARYAAPTKGAIGRLNWRANLPASGPPQRQPRDDTAVEPRLPSPVRS